MLALSALVSACIAGNRTGPSRGHLSRSDEGSTDTRSSGSPHLALKCGDAVSGELGSKWRAHATSVGSLHVIGGQSREVPSPSVLVDTAPTPGQITFIKTLLVVQSGQTVTIELPSSQRRVALWYKTTGLPQSPSLGDGTVAVTFEACPEMDTQFAGGFLAESHVKSVVILVVEGARRKALTLEL